MTAFVIAEFNVKDTAALGEYVSAVGPLIARHGGEIIGRGPLQGLDAKDTKYQRAVVVAFPSRDAALAWYGSPDYIELRSARDRAMSAKFKLLA
jgi:uncharacterized protein (DUF1330 family)